jgi:sulfur-oxidizing protein SoxY
MSMDKLKTKVLGRRQILKSVGLGALALAGTGLASKSVQATPDKATEYLSKLTSGTAGTKGKVTVKLPEIAENGRTVPITVSVDSPMTDSDYVKSVHIVSEPIHNQKSFLLIFRLQWAKLKLVHECVWAKLKKFELPLL